MPTKLTSAAAAAIAGTISSLRWLAVPVCVLLPDRWREPLYDAVYGCMGCVAAVAHRLIGGSALRDRVLEAQAHRAISRGAAWAEIAPIVRELADPSLAVGAASHAWATLFCTERYEDSREAASEWVAARQRMGRAAKCVRSGAATAAGFFVARSEEALRMSERALGAGRPQAVAFCRRWRATTRVGRFSIYTAPESRVFADTDGE